MKTLLTLFCFLTTSIAVLAQDVCTTAVTATTGTNSLPATTQSTYWYSYTIPSNAKLIITLTSSEIALPL